MLGRTNTGGGGGGLNFSVVGGTTAPSSPKENMIWINTDKKITSWVFSATEPKNLIEGMVWISTSTFSAVEFNALKKNNITVYPLSTKHYIGGVLTDVTAMIYQDMDWKDLAMYLYDNGNECVDLSGGWIVTRKSGATSKAPVLTKNSDSLGISCASGSTYSGNITHGSAVDLTNSNKLFVNVSELSMTGGAIRLRLNKKADGNKEEEYILNQGITAVGVVSVDISTLKGEYYVMLYTYSPSSSALSYTVTEVYHK